MSGSRLVSADSHVIEPTSVWNGLLPPSFWPDNGKMFKVKPGSDDPQERIKMTAQDGVTGEILYPSLGLKLFQIEDVALHEQSLHVYNEWLASYCRVYPDRLFGVGMIPTYDVDRALEEIEYCQSESLCGVMVWQSPHPDLPFDSAHYDPIWAEAGRRKLPVSLHILTGFDYSRGLHTASKPQESMEVFRNGVNRKVLAAMDALLGLIASGALERSPDVRFVVVENEIGWLPFTLAQWDYYYDRFRGQREMAISRPPSTYFYDQVFSTFFRDSLTSHLLDWWGADNCMWSNDYPHGNSTWPDSREFVSKHLGRLPPGRLEKVLSDNVERLYGIDTLAPQ